MEKPRLIYEIYGFYQKPSNEFRYFFFPSGKICIFPNEQLTKFTIPFSHWLNSRFFYPQTICKTRNSEMFSVFSVGRQNLRGFFSFFLAAIYWQNWRFYKESIDKFCDIFPRPIDKICNLLSMANFRISLLFPDIQWRNSNFFPTTNWQNSLFFFTQSTNRFFFYERI